MSTLNMTLSLRSTPLNSLVTRAKKRAKNLLASETAQKTLDAAIALVALALIVGAAFAASTGTPSGTTEVAKISTWIQEMTEGAMGTVFALGTLAVGLATGIVRQTLMPVAVAVGMAATAKWGPGILVGITGTVI